MAAVGALDDGADWGGSGPGRHPLLTCADAIDEALKDVADLDPGFAPTSAKREALVTLSRLVDRVESLRLGVIAASHDVAEAEAARSVGSWVATQVLSDRAPQAAAEHLAHDLRGLYLVCRDALRDGHANLAQVRVIVRSLNELRHLQDVTTTILARAEEVLVAECVRLTPHELKIAGDRVLETIDPDVFEEAERKKLEDELRRSRAEARLRMRNRGDGSTDVHARVPVSLAARLKGILEAFTSPRHGQSTDDGSRYRDPATGERLPQERLMGQAFCAFLERYDPAAMPRHGGTATTLVISVDFDAITRELGIGTLPDGNRIPASEVRRLACNAGVLPVVLSSRSVPLDMGRLARLFTTEQRIALGLAHSTCRATGCYVPAAWCEAHHRDSWMRGGATDIANGVLLCGHHHQRVHDDRYLVEHLPNGDVRFNLRR